MNVGDRVTVNDRLIIQVGNGQVDSEDDINYLNPTDEEESGDVDEFEEVTAAPATE